jgi:hypothetical protein
VLLIKRRIWFDGFGGQGVEENICLKGQEVTEGNRIFCNEIVILHFD